MVVMALAVCSLLLLLLRRRLTVVMDVVVVKKATRSMMSMPMIRCIRHRRQAARASLVPLRTPLADYQSPRVSRSTLIFLLLSNAGSLGTSDVSIADIRCLMTEKRALGTQSACRRRNSVKSELEAKVGTCFYLTAAYHVHESCSG